MNDNEKTKERLICELEELRQRIHELEPVDIEQTHKEGEELYQAILEDIPVLICRFLEGGEITYVNAEYCKYFEKTREELIGENLQILIPEEDRERVMANVSALSVDSPTQTHDNQVIAPDGGIRWHRWTNRAIFNSQGDVVVYQSVGQDITESKKAEEDLKKNEALLNEAEAIANFGSWNWGLENNRIEWSDNLFRLLGLKPTKIEKIDYTKALKYTHPDDKEMLEMVIQESITTKKAWHIDNRIMREGGKVRWVISRGKAIYDEKGKAVWMTGSMYDITERKQAEEQLKKYQEMVRQMNDGIVITNPQGTLLEINDCFTRMTGWTREDLVGTKPPYKYWRKTDVPIIMETLSDLRNLDQTVSAFEQILQKKDGGEIHGLVNSTILYDNNNKQKAFFGLFRDITDIKRAEESLHKETHALGERVKELNCLYGISKLVETPDITIDEVIQGTVDLIPSSWQYPQIACARTIIDGQKFETVPFSETSWKQSSKIYIFNKQSGILEVFYMEEKPETDEGPFLKEERNLIDAVAERLGRIIERMRAEEALHNEKEFTETALNAQQDTFFLFEPATEKAIRWNRAFSDITGYTDEEISLMPAPNSYHNPKDLERAVIFREKVLETGTGSIELELICKGGHMIPFEFRVAAIKDEDGNSKYLISIGRDITERKKAEEQIQASLKEKETLLQEIHHRVKNNMQVVASLLNLQKNRIDDEKSKTAFEESRDRINSMGLVHELLYQSESLCDIDLGEYVKKLTDNLFGVGGTNLKLDIETISIGIDQAVPCGLVINELISNSLKHAYSEGESGTIEINVHLLGEEIELEITDDGHGISEDLENMNTLGLMLVKGLVESQLHGTWDISSSNAGTKHTIRFKKK